MSFTCIQSSLNGNLNELALFGTECEETIESTTLQDTHVTGGLKTPSKRYSCHTIKISLLRENKTLAKLSTLFKPQKPCTEKPSLMHLAKVSSFSSPQKSSQTEKSVPTHSSLLKPNTEKHLSQSTTQPSSKSQALSQPSQALPKVQIASEKTVNKTTVQKQSERYDKRDANFLTSHKWSYEETKQWWEERYHQKERGGDQQKQDQQEDQREDQPHHRTFKVSCSAPINRNSTHSSTAQSHQKVNKPELSPPKMGVFALYYILTKIGIQSDGAGNFAYKKEIELIDYETTETHRKRLEELKESIKQEKENTRWSVAAKVFSMIGSLIAIISGILMLATGVGAVAGAMLMIGGLIQVSNQIMEMTGGWQKIIQLLPGDDREKKAAIVAWMQIGVSVLCLILSGVGIIWGGYSHFQEVYQIANHMMGALASIGQGITVIGYGINLFMFKNKLSELKQFEVQLAKLKHQRSNLMEKVEWGVDRLEQLLEDIAKALEFEVELFQADQMVVRG
jgi:Secretion system effector C (SseC) like family